MDNNEKNEFSKGFKYNCVSPTACGGTILPTTEDMLLPPKCRRKHFLKYFLDASYYLCLIPYKIIDAGDGIYRKKSFIFQQVWYSEIYVFHININNLL